MPRFLQSDALSAASRSPSVRASYSASRAMLLRPSQCLGCCSCCLEPSSSEMNVAVLFPVAFSGPAMGLSSSLELSAPPAASVYGGMKGS